MSTYSDRVGQQERVRELAVELQSLIPTLSDVEAEMLVTTVVRNYVQGWNDAIAHINTLRVGSYV